MAGFHSIYSHGFARVAVVVPFVRVADPPYNVARMLDLAQRAHVAGAALVLFPELGISAYTNDDLFHQDALLDAVLAGLQQLCDASASLAPLLIVGAPLRIGGRLFNCAIAIHQGRILGVTPKSYLPNYREFYEKRQFAAAREALVDQIELLGQQVPFGTNLLYSCATIPDLLIHTEICEDVWTPIPPSTYAALAGATVLCNLSASNITVGKADYRRDLCASQSGKCVAAYLYSAAGPGESTTDLAWDGDALIYENGELLAESERFSAHEDLILADIDLERLQQDRMRLTSFGDAIGDLREQLKTFRRIAFRYELPAGDLRLLRQVNRFPYVPNDTAKRDERCFEVYNIQIHGLAKRLQSSGIQKLVIGVSGGLDSTHALIVAARTMDRLGLPRTNILAYTMPGFATSSRTLANAHALMNGLGVSAHEIDIRPACLQMLHDIGHPYANGDAVYDITFENVQAGERTSHLFRLANLHNALVLGTGDLSELALGWCTYGVGDHMSHYAINASVPKTLMQYLIRWVIVTRQFSDEACLTLRSILETEISPELVPTDGGGDQPGQSTEAKNGPYSLQDFNLYYILRYGFRPSKVAFLSYSAWADATNGIWPEGIASDQQVVYDLATIKRWLRVFVWRFFQISQFKRSAIPNGPKVGSGGSLSPRGDWRAPSDSESAIWLAELDAHVPDKELV
jgi:NAD+ synthase (glutamine-hydrolysing)